MPEFTDFVNGAPAAVGTAGKIPIVQGSTTHAIDSLTLGGGTVNVVSPVGGGTVVFPDMNPIYVNSGPLGSLTVQLPANPGTNIVEICFAAPVVVLTVTDSFGNPLASAPTSAYGPGSALAFRFISGSTWVYWK